MRLNPRYDGPPIISVEVRGDGPHPLLAQRARFVTLLEELSDEEWQHPSRCVGWTVQDVVTHLSSTNMFWALSIQAGAQGEPTRFLATFDPATSPAELVEQARGRAPAETLQQFVSSYESLVAAVDALDASAWDAIAEAPVGHLPIRLVADHGLWDSWIHERDIVLPLQRPPVSDANEVLTCLRYAAALGPAFAVSNGDPSAQAVVLEVTDPRARIVVVADRNTVHIHDGETPSDSVSYRGDAVELLEMLSIRDVGTPVPDEIRSMTSGLARVFDQESPV